ncbi:MAG: hypothetical protein ACE5EX_11205 [Phycisphaerae bacterium]
MLRRGAILGLLVIAGTAIAGCAAVTRTAPVRHSRSTHLIFNPQWTGIPPSAVARGEWPSTFAYESGEELIDYRESYIDRQGTYGHDRDQLIRRFYQRRTGRIRR